MASISNNSNIPLASGGTFNGLYEELSSGVESIQVNIKTDQPGIFRVFFAITPSVLLYEKSYTYVAGEYFFISVPKIATYYRCNFTNGGIVPQTYFELRTTFNSYLLVDDPSAGAAVSDATTHALLGTTNTELASIDSNLTPLQYEKNEYNLSANAILAPDTLPAYSAPPSLFPQEGWYYKNTGGAQASQLYYYSYLNLSLAVPARQKAYTISEINNSYAIIRILNINETNSLPFLAVYSRPTGSGDYAPWYKSRWVYKIPATVGLVQGQQILIWFGYIEPSSKIHPEIKRIQCQLSSTNGSALDSEILAYLTLNTDSAALANNVEYIVKFSGFTADNTVFDTELISGDSTASIVSVSNFPGSQTVNGTVAVSSITSPVSISGTVPVSISGTIPVSGSVAITNSSLSSYVYGTPDNGTTWQPIKTTSGSQNVVVDSGTITGSVSITSGSVNFTNSSINSYIYGSPDGAVTWEPLKTTLGVQNVIVDSISSSVSVNGTVAVSSITSPVSISGTVPVSISGTVPVSGTVAVSGITGTVATSSTITNFPATQAVSIAGTVPISSGSPLDTHCYGSSDGTTWHHLKTNPTGILLTNSQTQDGTGLPITSSVPGVGIQALDVAVKNSVSISGTVPVSISGTIPVSGSVSISGDVSANMKTAVNGDLTSTLSGTGNSIHSLDVYLQNSSIVAKSQPTQATTICTAELCNCSGPADSKALGAGLSVSTAGFLYATALLTVTGFSMSGYANPQIYIQSGDGTTWFNESSYGIGNNGVYKITIYSTVVLPYLRLYLDCSSITSPNIAQFNVTGVIYQK